jgi:hypothetical protein
MKLNDLDSLFKYYYFENEGWEGVWRRNYKRIQKLSLEDKKAAQKHIKRRFGRNMRRLFLEMLLTPDPLLSRLAKPEFKGALIPVPLTDEKQHD